ncbi:fibronectin-binding protein A N-terminus-domain-containing protein [Scenedesmus sp. NREL 46B-D3]|nr:fibronectin-binding protein A N-terminus-domain-containing protein [Scenedesmus sp. NREL 46B-D3]
MIGASGSCRASLLSGCSRMLSSSRCSAPSIAWICQPSKLKAFHFRQFSSRSQLYGCTSQHAHGLLVPPAAAVQQGAAVQVRQAATEAAVVSGSAVPQVQEQQLQRQQRRSDGSRVKQQTLDYTVLAACCHELAGSWVPSKVEEVVQPDRYTLSLRLRTPLAQGWLHLSWHPTAARVAVGQPPMRGDVSEAFSFAAQATAQLKGLVLLSARLPAPWERVVQLDFGSRPGEAPSRSVFCEVMAKYSNAVLTSGDGSVLHCAYQVGAAMSSLRQVQAGRQYQLPPPVNGVPPSAQEPLDSWQRNVTRAAALAAAEQSAAASKSAAAAAGGRHGAGVPAPRGTVLSGATRAYMGVSPALVQELCATAGVAPTASPDTLPPEAWQALHGAWQAWLDRLHSGSFTPSSCPATGKFSVIGSYSQPHTSAHDMVEGYYRGLQAGEVYAGLHQRLSTAVKQALKKARGRARSFEQQLQAADEVAAVQKQADIIVANIYRLEPNASQLEAEDWDTGKPVLLTLDPTKSPMEQAEALYRRARKLRRAVDAVQPLLEAATREAEYLETVELELAQMPPGGTEQQLAALREVQEELVESKVIKSPPEAALSAKAAAKGRKAQKKQHKAATAAAGSTTAGLNSSLAAAAAAGLRRYVSPGGFTVLVGRNNKQNDVLSHQVAKAGDIWMHVRGMPGSHTVLRVEAGREPGQEDVQFAADLAAWFSKAREAGKADVIVARAEHLKKFKGAKPGQVLVTKEEKNVVARPDNSAAAQAASASGGQDE